MYRTAAARDDDDDRAALVVRSHGPVFLASVYAASVTITLVALVATVSQGAFWLSGVGIGVFMALAMAWYATTARLRIDAAAGELVVEIRTLFRARTDRFALHDIARVWAAPIDESPLELLKLEVHGRELHLFRGSRSDVRSACQRIEDARERAE